MKTSNNFQSIEKEIDNLKNEIKKMTKEKIMLKKNLKSLENITDQETATETVSDRNSFKCSDCDFVSKSKSGLTTHIKRKHKIPQIDGSSNITDDEGETNYTIKVTFVSETMENAKQDLLNYYVCDLTPVHSDSFQFLEKESGTIYEGQDHCYNKGDHKEYVFIFDVDKKYSKEDIENIVAIDAVKKFDFIEGRPKIP